MNRLLRLNWLGGSFAWIWLLIVMIPLYWIVITSFKTRANYYAQNPLAPPSSPTLENYRLVIEADFTRYFLNSVIAVILVLFGLGLALLLRRLGGGSATDSQLEGA